MCSGIQFDYRQTVSRWIKYSKFRMWNAKMDVLTILSAKSLRENIVNKKTASCQFRDIFSKRFKLCDRSLAYHLPSLLETIPENIYPALGRFLFRSFCASTVPRRDLADILQVRCTLFYIPCTFCYSR